MRMTMADVIEHQRRIKKPEPDTISETESPFTVTDEISQQHEPFKKWLNYHKLVYINARSDKPSTIAKGCFDFIVVRGDKVVFIEFKRKGGVLSKDQEGWKMMLEFNDTPNMVAYDVNDAIQFVKEKLGVEA